LKYYDKTTKYQGLRGRDRPHKSERSFPCHYYNVERVPNVTWTPNLNTNGEVRVYKVWGKADLMDSAWTYPTNSAHRFFKVTVEMP